MANDDHNPFGLEEERITPLYGRRIEIGEYNFAGCQHTPPFLRGVFVKTDEEIAADLPRLAPLLDERTVLVTHTPAFRSLDNNVGSRAIPEFLVGHPALAHVHGHIHSRFGSPSLHHEIVRRQ